MFDKIKLLNHSIEGLKEIFDERCWEWRSNGNRFKSTCMNTDPKRFADLFVKDGFLYRSKGFYSRNVKNLFKCERVEEFDYSDCFILTEENLSEALTKLGD